MRQSDSAVNQQGTFTNEDLAWLGGILDGDGCFSLYLHHRKRKKPFYVPEIQIANSDKGLIEECVHILESAHIPKYIECRQQRPRRRDMWFLHISGIKRCARALPILLPHVRAKKKQAQVLLEFCKRRLELGPVEYAEEDHRYYRELKELKRKGSSETKSQARK